MVKMSHVSYSSAMGDLTYAMVCTRPDLSYVVSIVSSYMHYPGKDHWEAIKWILSYVKVSLDRFLAFDNSKTTTYDVTRFVDFDYSRDVHRRRSISGYIFTLYACVIF